MLYSEFMTMAVSLAETYLAWIEGGIVVQTTVVLWNI